MHRMSDHYLRVRTFMEKASQGAPAKVGMPDEKTRLLRARLIYEEAVETVHALGCYVNVDDNCTIEIEDGVMPDLVEIVDGCADISVVTIGTLIACGVPDIALLELVDYNNLAKFGPGHSIRPDGKVIKPKDHKPPNIKRHLEELGRYPTSTGL